MAPRAGAALFASPQQPATVHGCPVSGHLKLDTSSVGEINHRIKLSAQWRDVANIVLELGDRLQPNNIAYALFRLGCLFCFLSSQRRAGMYHPCHPLADTLQALHRCIHWGKAHQSIPRHQARTVLYLAAALKL